VYGDKVRIVWKHLPLDMHKSAMGAHLAAVAAEKQGKFWEFHDKLFANQQQLNLDAYKRYARELKLDAPRFEKDLADLANKEQIDDDKAEAQSMGVTGTPGFFVNGRYLSGAKPFEEFAKAIDAELTRLNLPVPTGAPAR
jgi:protein-disulfide isomerase